MTENEQVAPDEQPTTRELVFDLVKSRMLTIAALIVFVTSVAVFFGVSPTVPRWLRLAMIVGLLVSPAGLWAGGYIIKLLPDPHMVWLLDLEARDPEAALYQFPARDFAELNVLEGELDQCAPSLYIGKQVNLEEMTVVGTWRGTLSDRELLRALSKIDECRGQLQEDAQRGFAIESQAFTIIRGSVRDATRTIVSTFENDTLPDRGEGIEQRVDDALEQFELDDRFDDDLEVDADDLGNDGLDDQEETADPDPLADDVGPTEVATDD